MSVLHMYVSLLIWTTTQAIGYKFIFYTSENLRLQEPNKSSLLIYGMSQVINFHPYTPLRGHET